MHGYCPVGAYDFLKRFLPGSRSSLRSLEIVADIAHSTPLLSLAGPDVAQLCWAAASDSGKSGVRADPRNRNVPDLLEAVHTMSFRLNLTSLYLNFGVWLDWSKVLEIAPLVPNLRLLGVLYAGMSDGSHKSVASALDDMVNLLPKLQRLQVFVCGGDHLFEAYQPVDKENAADSRKVCLRHISAVSEATVNCARLTRVLSSARLFASLSTYALSVCSDVSIVEAIVGLDWPMHVDGTHSVLGALLWEYSQGKIERKDILHVLRPIFARMDAVHLDATLACEYEYHLNPIQLALLTGDERVLGAVLECIARLAPDSDLHQLACSSGDINIITLAVELLPTDFGCHKALSLIFERQSLFGLSPSMCYAEGRKGRTVLEAALGRHFGYSVRFLLDHGIEISCPKNFARHWNAPQPLLHLVYSFSLDPEAYKSKKFAPPEIPASVETLVLDQLALITRANLNLHPAGRTGASMLAYIVHGSSKAILERALSVSTPAQRNQALADICYLGHFNAAHEKLLVQSGVDPLTLVGNRTLNRNVFMAAAEASLERMLLILSLSKRSILASTDAAGQFPVHYALRSAILDSDVDVKAFRLLIQPAVVYENLKILGSVADRFRWGHPKFSTASCSKFCDDLRRLWQKARIKENKMAANK